MKKEEECKKKLHEYKVFKEIGAYEMSSNCNLIALLSLFVLINLYTFNIFDIHSLMICIDGLLFTFGGTEPDCSTLWAGYRRYHALEAVQAVAELEV